MPELRKDPVIGRWVIISTERGKRPYDFTKKTEENRKGGFCPFCERNEIYTPSEVLAYRKSGSKPNGPDWTVRVVPNKFPALEVEGELERRGLGMYDMMNGIGAHEVIIENPNHNIRLGDHKIPQIIDVLWAYRDRMIDLKRDTRFKYIIIFKNQGVEAGASLEHPHSQLIALPIIPKRVTEELQGSERYYHYKERCIFCDIIAQEKYDNKRIITENEDFISLAPFASRFPFEIWLLPKTHSSSFENIQRVEIEQLANILKETLTRLNKAIDYPSYNMVLHTAPLKDSGLHYYHWHIELIPKLTKVAGFEWGSGFYINPTPPETAAKFLREVDLNK